MAHAHAHAISVVLSNGNNIFFYWTTMHVVDTFSPIIVTLSPRSDVNSAVKHLNVNVEVHLYFHSVIICPIFLAQMFNVIIVY